MSNIQNIDVSLQEIVKNISKNTYLIPKFQRDFVWKDRDIIDLGDSLIRGYPISSLLIMAENGSLNVGSHTLSKDDPPKDYQQSDDDSDMRYFVLDGQQRLTSISRLFLNFDASKEYYFDLLAILCEKYPNDNIENDSGVKESFLTSKLTDILCRSFPISKDKSEKSTRQNNRFISGKSIIENRSGSVVAKFLRHFKDADEDTMDNYVDHLNAVFGSVGGYSVPATVIARDSELGIVIRVFEKVNSTGKKLTLFDLINAKSFQVNDKIYSVGLSDYLNSEIEKLLSVNQSLSKGVYNFLKFDESSKTYEKLDKIIRILEISKLLRSGVSPSIFQSTMLSKDPIFWFEEWNSHGKTLLSIMEWMEEEGLIDIGQITFLEYASAIFIANTDSFCRSKFKKEIKKYALFLSLSGTGFSKSNLDMVERLYGISKQITDAHESNQYNYDSPSSSPSLTGDQLLEITTSNAKFKSILNILYIDKVKGLCTIDIAGNKLNPSCTKEQDRHHLFPKSRVNGYHAKSIFNSIANFVILDDDINRINIKDKTPNQYLSELKSQDSSVPDYCKSNLIDFNEAINITSEDEAKYFIEKRAKNIAFVINNYFHE